MNIDKVKSAIEVALRNIEVEIAEWDSPLDAPAALYDARDSLIAGLAECNTYDVDQELPPWDIEGGAV